MTELDTFICKFHQLWQCGQTAHLDLDTHAGTAWVGLRVQLGHHPPAPLYHHPGYHHPQHVPRASPSRERRRKRRAAAAAQRNDVNAFSVTVTQIVVDAFEQGTTQTTQEEICATEEVNTQETETINQEDDEIKIGEKPASQVSIVKFVILKVHGKTV